MCCGLYQTNVFSCIWRTICRPGSEPDGQICLFHTANWLVDFGNWLVDFGNCLKRFGTLKEILGGWLVEPSVYAVVVSKENGCFSMSSHLNHTPCSCQEDTDSSEVWAVVETQRDGLNRGQADLKREAECELARSEWSCEAISAIHYFIYKGVVH